MKILVYGAGVLGCNLARNLLRAGKDVTLLARGNWAAEIRRNGLRIKDKFSLRTSVSRIPVVLSSPFVLLGFPLPVILLYGICRIKSIAFQKIIAKNSKSGGKFPPLHSFSSSRSQRGDTPNTLASTFNS